MLAHLKNNKFIGSIFYQNHSRCILYNQLNGLLGQALTFPRWPIPMGFPHLPPAYRHGLVFGQPPRLPRTGLSGWRQVKQISKKKQTWCWIVRMYVRFFLEELHRRLGLANNRKELFWSLRDTPQFLTRVPSYSPHFSSTLHVRLAEALPPNIGGIEHTKDLLPTENCSRGAKSSWLTLI